MENSVRTIFSSYLQSAQMLGVPHEIKEFTTLNEKHGIQSGIAIPPGTYPRVQYYCIGNGGHSVTMGADQIPLNKINQHRATDAALFKQLPFVLRKLGNDLTGPERAKYALRKEESWGGQIYIAYYLKRIDMTNVESVMDLRVIEDGVITSTPYVPSASGLTPTPLVLNNTGVNTLTGDYVTTSAVVSVGFTESEIAEYLNVANIVHGDDAYAIISEIGLCSGTDKLISVTPSSGSPFSFNEAIGVQINSFITANHICKYTQAGLEKFIDIGVNESLLNLI